MKRHVIVICFLAVCFWFTPGVNSAELRTWTSKSGKFTVKAELLSFDQGVVSLRRVDGKKIEVPLAKLSKEDRKYVLAEPKPKADPVAALEKLGARIKQNEQGEILELYFTGTQFTEAGVAELKKTLPKCIILPEDMGVAALEKLGAEIKRNEQGEIVLLDLTSSQDTNAALEHLKGLTELKTLTLYDTHQVTDPGLVHLKGLTKLEALHLKNTQVTDAGLVHLKGMINLEDLWLTGTQVSDAGVAELKKALLKCLIVR